MRNLGDVVRSSMWADIEDHEECRIGLYLPGLDKDEDPQPIGEITVSVDGDNLEEVVFNHIIEKLNR